MPRLVRIIAVTLVAIACLTAGAAPALAAPVPWESVTVSLHDDSGAQLLIVSGTLPASARLPAQVEIPVPAGSTLSWAGEILGGPPANDLAAATTTRVAGESVVHAFTLTKARTGQIEVLVPGAILFDGSRYTARLSWTPAADVPEVTAEVRVPTGAKILGETAGAQLVPGPGGQSAYRLVKRSVRAGVPVALEVAYAVPAGAQAPRGAAPASDSSGGVVLFAVVAVIVVAFLLVVVPRRVRKSADAAPEPATQAPVSAASEATEDEQDSEVGDAAEPAAAAPAARRGPLLIVGAVAAVLLALVAYSMSTTRQTQQLGGQLTREYAQGDACTKASIALADGADAEKVFGALETAQVIRAAIVPAERRLDVEFCDSQTTEQAIRAALGPLGVLE